MLCRHTYVENREKRLGIERTVHWFPRGYVVGIPIYLDKNHLVARLQGDFFLRKKRRRLLNVIKLRQL